MLRFACKWYRMGILTGQPFMPIKGIFSDFNIIFLWHESEDTMYKQKKLISKISVDSNFTFSSYAWLCVFHCSHRPCRLQCWIKRRVRDFLWKLLSFHNKMVSAQFLWGGVLLRGELRKYSKNLKFENCDNALYSISWTMPLSFNFFKKSIFGQLLAPNQIPCNCCFSENMIF